MLYHCLIINQGEYQLYQTLDEYRTTWEFTVIVTENEKLEIRGERVSNLAVKIPFIVKIWTRKVLRRNWIYQSGMQSGVVQLWMTDNQSVGW